MKVIKDGDLSLLFRPWGYGERYYLHLTVVCGFDLLDPENPIREQELWQKLSPLLGEQKVLDEGMPKMRGEYLITGTCHAPAGKRVRAAEVRACVGQMEKRLHVFGDRYWQRNPAGLQVISDPEPFAEMELGYTKAFGGPGFDKNPLGKGFGETGQEGQARRSLPNIELPGREIGSPSDRPDPAGYGPLDRMWPQRFKKTGTYGRQWQETRWPYFPADMDYEFFNLAPEDQRLDGFFSGDERFVLEGMHPEHRVIENRLPQVRPRQFVYKKKDLEKGFEAENLLFEEVQLNLDTVWLFPEGLLGVLVLHGSTRLLDEEYYDVHRLYLTRESIREEPKGLSHYQEKMLSAMDLSVPADMSPFQEKMPVFQGMLKKWRNIPKRIEESKKRAMGQAPKMSSPPEETSANLKGAIQGCYGVLDRLEGQARDMHAKHGHRMKIDLKQFQTKRERLARMEQQVDAMGDKAKETRQRAGETEKLISGQLKEGASSQDLQKAGVDPDNPLQRQSGDPWRDTAFSLVLQARRTLQGDPMSRERLAALGLERDALKRGWLGVLTEPQKIDSRSLQLSSQDMPEDPLELPPGLLLPVFEGNRPCRVAVRPGQDWSDPKEDIPLPGSREDALLLPASLGENPPVIVISEHLSALLLEQEVGDACSVLWLPGVGTELGEEESRALESALQTLIIPISGDDPQELEKWSEKLGNAELLSLPQGESSLFEARDGGLNLRSWILQALPEGFAREHDIEIGLPEAGSSPKGFLAKGLNLPPLDIKGMIGAALGEINASNMARKNALQKDMSQLLDQTTEKLGKPRVDVDSLVQAAKGQEADSPQGLGDHVVEQLRAHREDLKTRGQLTSEKDAKLQKNMNQVRADADRAQKNRDGLQARRGELQSEMESRKAQLRDRKLPEESAERMRRVGMDPERMRSLTREEVVELHGRGKSLADYDLSRLDLSGLDLSGADLTRARCLGTDFSKTVLAGAELSKLMANKADFSQADLTGVRSEMALFPEAVMCRADWRGCRLKQVSFQKADLSETDFSESDLNLCSMKDCTADGASFREASLELMSFNQVRGTGMQWGGVRGHKCVFQSCRLDQSDFSEATLPSCMFMRCQGEGLVFFGADLSGASICRDSSLTDCDFRRSSMKASCLRDSALPGADMRGAHMEGTIIQGCDLSRACLRKTVAARTKLERCCLEQADLRGINLLSGSLRKSRLVNADLSFSNLYGANVYKVVMGRTELKEANLKMTLLAGRSGYLE